MFSHKINNVDAVEALLCSASLGKEYGGVILTFLDSTHFPIFRLQPALGAVRGSDCIRRVGWLLPSEPKPKGAGTEQVLWCPGRSPVQSSSWSTDGLTHPLLQGSVRMQTRAGPVRASRRRHPGLTAQALAAPALAPAFAEKEPREEEGPAGSLAPSSWLTGTGEVSWGPGMAVAPGRCLQFSEFG